MEYRIAALQFLPAFMDKAANLVKLEALLRALDADLAVVPELATTGYWFESREQLLSLSEGRDGAACTLFRDLALEHRMTVIAGFAERDGDRVYNAAAVATPDGALHVYRKTHLFAEEKDIFTPGDSGFQVIDCAGVRIGTMICYDWRFPESARTLALRGAQIIAHPSALVALPRLWQPVMRARSFENKVYTVTADRIGTETHGAASLTFHGCSQITDINGAVLAETDEVTEGWIAATVDPARTLDKSFSRYNDIFADRRPDCYEC
ncbi:MAG: hypothetical protein IPP94_16955 [Ignavibacteria bacterium]|nr:hypothetical protein [Ignavibacteria bacterium]